MAAECTYCEERVNAKRGIYIKCATCSDIKLCLECFSAGVTIGEHQSDHPYELIDCGSFPIIDESWKAHEELALLEAIELYGIGSWTDIANAVGTRDAEECCDRYLRVYVDNFFGRTTWNAIDKNQYTVQDHTCTHNQPLSPSLSLPEKHKIVDIHKEQQTRLGYMPRRDDFEREYDNEAEFLVSKLAVNANDDTELDQELKVAHINMYTDKLRERFRRKRIVLEYNLVKLFFHMHPEENGGDIHQMIKPSIPASLLPIPHSANTMTSSAGPFQSQPNSDSSSSITKSTLTNTAVPSIAMITNRNLATTSEHDPAKPSFSTSHNHPETDSQLLSTKNNLESTSNDKPSQPVQRTILNYFRRVEPTNGNTINKDSPSGKPGSILSSYFSDLNKTIAEEDFNTMEKRLRIFCQFSSAEDHNRLIRNLAREKELKVKIRELVKKRKAGLKFHDNLVTNQSDTNESDPSVKPSPTPNKKNPIKSTQSNNLDRHMDVEIDHNSTLLPAKVTPKKNKNESTKAIMNLHLNQNSEPSWRLLSESEKRLCKSSNLKPSQYISFKAFIIKEHNQKKKKGAAQRLFTDNIDKTVKRRIVDFLTRNNWIKV